LQLGVSKKDITPEIGGHLYGYGDALFSSSLHDPLYATAFVFGYGDLQYALINVTVVAVGAELVDEIRTQIQEKTGIPYDNIMIAATHTHSGPSTKKSAGWGDVDRPYCDGIFVPQILSAVTEAKSAMTAVTMAIATGESYVGINRREFVENNITLGQNPWGCMNPKMTVISFKNAENTVVANMIHYGAHGTAAGYSERISRDWPGFMTDRLEKESGAITAFFNGPEGDIGPRLVNGKTMGTEDIRIMYQLGEQAAEDAMRIYNTIGTYEEVDMESIETVVKMPLEKRVSKEEAQAGYEEFKDSDINTRRHKAHYFKSVLDSYEVGYTDMDEDVIPQSILRLGDLVFVSSPYELFSEIGLRVQKMSSFPHVLMLINTNGTEAYFPTASQLPLGGYEIYMFQTNRIQPFKEPSDWSLIQGTVQNVESLKKK
ncbi:MAG: neutral/alkaline non-lysosomal ceramidase N-terminal domain-containing protein, partial [Clostridia bacterium]|nr:neutral/alkaline non-lysosomal ceramidase N-terminal domain-containing protein [Clostridia bacterium]